MFGLTISRTRSNMGYVQLKSRSLGQILRIFCLHSRGHICDSILMELSQNDFFTISRTCSNMGHVRSKTRSPGKILGNSCLHFRDHIRDPILMKLCQKVCLDNI